MVYHGKGTRTQLKVALEGGYGHLVIYGHFTSYFIAECFMHHVNLYVIRVLVELMLCDEKLGKNVLFFFFLAMRQWFTGFAWLGLGVRCCIVTYCVVMVPFVYGFLSWSCFRLIQRGFAHPRRNLYNVCVITGNFYVCKS